MQKQQDERVCQAVLKLPVKQRTVVVLYYFNGLSTKEIANVLHSMEGTVKSRLYTARRNLKEMLQEEQKSERKANDILTEGRIRHET